MKRIKLLIFAILLIAQSDLCFTGPKAIVNKGDSFKASTKAAIVKLTDADIKSFLTTHNIERVAKGCPALVWDNELALVAQKYALKLADLGRLEHSKNNVYGENLFMGYGKDYTIADAAKSWLSEKIYFTHKKFSANDMKAGHYTQMIWKRTLKVGAAKVVKNGNIYVVANYSPAGNYLGQEAY